jgi:hypothetical protein
MSNWQAEAYGPVGARREKIECIAVSDAAAVIDLATRTNIYGDLQLGRLCMADADGNDVYYAFTSESTGAIDDTATTAGGATQCARIPTGVPRELRPPMQTQAEVNGSAGAITATGMCRYLAVKCASGKSATLRLSIVTEPANKRLG